MTSTPGDGRADWGSEPVAAAELGPDKVAVFAKSFAQRGDLNLQVFFRDNDAWPAPDAMGAPIESKLGSPVDLLAIASRVGVPEITLAGVLIQLTSKAPRPAVTRLRLTQPCKKERERDDTLFFSDL